MLTTKQRQRRIVTGLRDDIKRHFPEGMTTDEFKALAEMVEDQLAYIIVKQEPKS